MGNIFRGTQLQDPVGALTGEKQEKKKKVLILPVGKVGCGKVTLQPEIVKRLSKMYPGAPADAKQYKQVMLGKLKNPNLKNHTHAIYDTNTCCLQNVLAETMHLHCLYGSIYTIVVVYVSKAEILGDQASTVLQPLAVMLLANVDCLILWANDPTKPCGDHKWAILKPPLTQAHLC